MKIIVHANDINSRVDGDSKHQNDPWSIFLAELQGDYAALVRSLWLALVKVVPGLRTPQAGTIPGGGFQFIWDSTEFHLSIDVYTLHIEWFAADRATGVFTGDDFDIATDIPAELVNHLKHFTLIHHNCI